MSTKLAKIEKRTAYLLILPSVLLVFSIILFPIFSNIWISFKNVELKDLRIPEPRAKKLVKSIKENPNQIKVIYKLRNSSLTQEITNVKFKDKYPDNFEPISLNNKCQFKSNLLKCELGNWPKKYRENLEIVFQNTKNKKGEATGTLTLDAVVDEIFGHRDDWISFGKYADIFAFASASSQVGPSTIT